MVIDSLSPVPFTPRYHPYSSTKMMQHSSGSSGHSATDIKKLAELYKQRSSVDGPKTLKPSTDPRTMTVRFQKYDHYHV